MLDLGVFNAWLQAIAVGMLVPLVCSGAFFFIKHRDAWVRMTVVNATWLAIAWLAAVAFCKFLLIS